MADLDLNFIPHSDMNPDDSTLVEQHENLIKQNKFSDATTLLNDNDYSKGFRASLFNAIEKKLQDIEIYLLNKVVAEPDEYYSLTEPDLDFMEENNKTYWIQPY